MSPAREIIFVIAGIGFVLFLFSYFRAHKNIFQDAFFGITSCIFFFIIGICTVFLHNPENQPQHYVNISKEDIQPEFLELKIEERLKDGFYTEKFIGRVISGNHSLRKPKGKNLHGKILLNIEKDSTLTLKVGQHILVPCKLSSFAKPLNPYAFDYGKYMKQLDVLKQVNLSAEEVYTLNIEELNLKTVAAGLREKSIERLKDHAFPSQEMAIIQALILGERRDISGEAYKNYAAAGAVHILAISGLHVGIILLILNWILKPVEILQGGKTIKLLLILCGLWSYAFVAGLSPSVIRAVSMFSFLAVGMQINRRTSTMNTLFMSLLVLLLINPFYILQVGFQLSYLAVFAIISIQPELYRIFQPENRPVDYLWKILSVSIAAQIGVFPLSLYYFHQFPGLFFITNLVILPFLGLILAGGILIVLLALLNILPEPVAEIYGYCISLMNDFINFIAGNKAFIFSDIYFTRSMAIAAYFLIAAGIIYVYKQRYRTLVMLLSGIILLQCLLIFNKAENSNSEFTVFHKNRNTLLGLKHGNQLKISHSDSLNPQNEPFLKEYLVNNKIEKIEYESLQNIYSLNGKQLLVLDSTAIYNIPNLHPDILLLTSSPQLNLERLIAEFHPEIIIADGSNFKSYVKRWRKTSKHKKIPFHYTGEKGAFQLN
ncbi:ComEC/Rec2 family competence protein [Autumnicola musiva]|uniref:ComEC/Rec2 family competence protein n=1 Tax=Autumnicola musiva TaxID=3075589 RepID=A0ABU3D0D6_9FLAO|nr:ComEC/Rec2 family competence protein [Zunongwangia sp. F117]MDT0675001.1 ComEC/Rec2 family competence protein [Zunongwangia sp. F117]